MSVEIGEARESDYGAILALNEAALPHVSVLSRDALARLHREAYGLFVARDGGAVAGFLLTLTETAEYESPNFLWFRDRYDRFVYVDRIVVGEAWRGRGIGQMLYRELETRAATRCDLVTCEVNVRPPNDGSLRFHRAWGYREVGKQDTEGGTKRVSLQVKRLRSRPLLILKTGATFDELARAEGDFEDWFLREVGTARESITIVDVRTEELPPVSAEGGVIVTGSPEMVTERADWMERSGAWLREVVEVGRPVLGVCFGHQLLAQVLGGVVAANPNGRECGTIEMHQEDAGPGDPLLGCLPRTFVAHSSHLQSVRELPPGAVPLARSSRVEVQAARFGARAWGVQFHPEFSESITRAYVKRRAPELAEEGRGPAALLAGIAPSEAARLLTRFEQICARTPGP
jgi:GMP synthase (glutamine-hydrolysing)